jgi:hypothetical protein
MSYWDTARAFAIAKLKVFEVCRAQKRQCGTLAPEVLESLCAAVEPETLVKLTDDRRVALEACIEELTPRARDVNRYNAIMMCDDFESGELHWQISQKGTMALGVQGTKGSSGYTYRTPPIFPPDICGHPPVATGGYYDDYQFLIDLEETYPWVRAAIRGPRRLRRRPNRRNNP